MLILGGTVVDAAGARRADLRVGGDGRIAEVYEAGPSEPAAGGGGGETAGDGPSFGRPRPGEAVYDATGKLVVPGGVDAHTHLEMPVGAIRVSDDFFTGTRAAALGGTTTVVDYVPVRRGEDPLEAASAWKAVAAKAAVDWGLHLTFPEAVEERTVETAVSAGITSFKLYLAYPDRLQIDDAAVLRLMRYARRHGALVNLHCENGGGIAELQREALSEGRTGVAAHAATRPAVLEAEAVTRAAALAEVADAPIFVVHLSSADALVAALAARSRGADLHAETCPQYLYLESSRVEGRDGMDFVCSPPLRGPRDREALWEGLAAGEISTVGTDHCPFWRADRRAGTRRREEGAADFTEVPGGLPGVETRMALVHEGVALGRLSLEDWVRTCAEMPARIFGLFPRKGSLMVGSDADLVIWDRARRQSLSASKLHMATDHSPYEEVTVTGWPELVLSRGRVVVEDGEFLGEPGWGEYLARAPYGR